MFESFQTGFNAVRRVASATFAKVVKNKIVASSFAFGVLGVSSAFAETTAANYCPIAKSATGEISFTPENVMNPIIDGLMSAYGVWAILVVIIIVVSLMITIFRKK